MKVKVNEFKANQKDFPKLMIHNDTSIVLFTEKGKGTLLSKDSHHVYCGYRQDWIMDGFKEFQGSITLSND